jgi:catechol 2,3-dioxygenase-like lactoylglutathione lyase family enzyme
MTDVGLTHIALEAADLDASVAFYASFAAMQVVHRREGVVWLSDNTRPFVIVLIASDRIAASLRPSAHLGVACATHEEVDRLAELAREQGRLIRGPKDAGSPVGYWVFIRDPDGHTLELSYGQEVGVTVTGSEPHASAPDRSLSD